MTQVGGAIPSKMEWRVKEIKRVLKQTINFTPTSGVTQVESGQKIIVDLPVNSLVALDTFTMTFDAWTDTPATPGNGTAGYTRCRFLPRNSSSIIQNLEVKKMDNLSSMFLIIIIFIIYFTITHKVKMA